jgi:anti-sigma factor RsiW
MKSSFIDLALEEIPPPRSRQLLAELNDCPACREEYAAIRSTLHISGQALRSATPREDFWPGYHQRLRHSLLAGSALENQAALDHDSAPLQPAGISRISQISEGSGLWLALRTLFTTSVRVPVPAAVALMVLFVISAVSLRSQGQANVVSTTSLAAVEPQVVTAPVVQEKVITRVVYVNRKNNRPRREQLDRTAFSNSAEHLASSSSDASRKTALNLVGFEPTDQVRLTVIKGSYRDEK